MATVYKRVGGKKIEKYLAVMPGVQGKLKQVATDAAHLAEAVLDEHRAQGHAQIEVDHGRVDWYTVLSDERGLQAAAAIEYGRGEGAKNGPSQGIYALAKAFGLAQQRRKGT